MEIINKKLRITDIKQGVKNQNRANIFIDGKYSFSLDIAQLVDFKLKIGQEITEAELAEYQQASAFGKLYQRALEWVLVRPRSVRETHDYLLRKLKENDSTISDILETLTKKHYLNDYAFAKYYAENRFTKKGISKKRLKMELMKKGVSSAIIEQVLSSNLRNDEEEIKKVIAKKRNKYDDVKLIQYLVRQGFDFELARNLVQTSETD